MALKRTKTECKTEWQEVLKVLSGNAGWALPTQAI